MWTKRQLVQQAFRKAGLAAFVFDLTPDQLQSAARDMDAMVAEWGVKGLRLSYPLTTDPDAIDLDAEVDLPIHATQCVYLQLAIRIAPDFGKTLSGPTLAAARSSLDALMIEAAQAKEIPRDGMMPAGAGNRQRDGGTFISPTDPAPIGLGDNGQLVF